MQIVGGEARGELRMTEMIVNRALCAALLVASFSAGAADLFFVVGQSNGGWRGDSPRIQVPGDVKLLSWSTAARYAAVDVACKQACPSIGPLDGVVPSFASTWTGLSKGAAHFAIYRKAESALTPTGADGKDYWTNYDAPTGVYQDALREFREGQQTAAYAAPEGIQHRYLIWIQGEVDAQAGVSAKEYKARLSDLFARFNKDLGAQGKPFDAMFIVGTGPFREVGRGSSGKKEAKAGTSDVAKLNAIVQAQESAAEEGKIVMVSRRMRSPLGFCAEGQGSVGCETADKLNYYASAYEALGAEMARHAFIFQAKGVKPLQPASCKADPSSCSSTVDVYSWSIKNSATAQPVYGTAPYEFDEAAYSFDGVRFALFQDMAPGRLALYRGEGSGKPPLTTERGSAKAEPLGYCYAAPTANASARLAITNQRGKAVVMRYPADVAGGGKQEKPLCYVS
jgi:hypothetical protein